MDATVRILRHRAAALRGIAGRLEGTPLLQLDRAAGPGTWTGAAADEFRAQLPRYQRDVLQAAEDLRWEAWLLDSRAEQREAELAAAANAMPGAI